MHEELPLVSADRFAFAQGRQVQVYDIAFEICHRLREEPLPNLERLMRELIQVRSCSALTIARMSAPSMLRNSIASK